MLNAPQIMHVAKSTSEVQSQVSWRKV